MVKKIGSTPPSATSGATRVQSTKTIESSKIGGVGQVRGTERTAPAGGVSPSVSGITPKQRDQLFKMVDEEADKMFGPEGLPESKKEAVKGAVKMVIDAGVVEEEGKEKG